MALPQLDNLFLTDGGLETTLIFHRGVDLPEFAAFDLLKSDEGTDELRRYFEPYLALARERGLGFVLDTATWRASPDWAAKLGHSLDELDELNRNAVALARDLAEQQPVPVVVNGVVGPRGDGYDPDDFMPAEEAERYHSRQIGVFADAGVDMVSAITMTYAGEAIGIVRAAAAAGVPAVISFTLETDGRLPDGTSLRESIERVDDETERTAAYFMINCAHPRHFEGVVEDGGAWIGRIRGLRANASTKSHAELDESEELDEGDPVQLGADYRALRPRLGNVTVLGGCCGTDHRHIGEVAAAWLA